MIEASWQSRKRNESADMSGPSTATHTAGPEDSTSASGVRERELSVPPPHGREGGARRRGLASCERDRDRCAQREVRSGGGVTGCWEIPVCGAPGEEWAHSGLKARNGLGSGSWAKGARREGRCPS